MNKDIEKFVTDFKLMAIFLSSMFFLPIFVIFYQNNGLSYSEVTALKAITIATVFLMEVPLGGVSDTFGIKKSILVAIFLYIISFLTTAFSATFFLFGVSAVLYGSAMALMSGCNSALLFGYLKRAKHEELFTKVNGNVSFYSQIVSAVCLLAGSFLFGIDLRLPYIATATSFFIAIIFLLRIWDQYDEQIDKMGFSKSINEYLYTLKQGTLLLKKKSILLPMMIGAFFTSSTIACFDIYQVVFTDYSIPVKYFGSIYAIFLIVSAFGSKFAFFYENIIKNKIALLNILVLAQVLLIGCLFFIPRVAWLFLLVFCLQEFLFGVAIIFLSHINRIIKNDKVRVTIISYSSLFTSAIKSTLYLVSGSIVTNYNFTKAFLFISIILFVAILIINVFFMMTKNSNESVALDVCH